MEPHHAGPSPTIDFGCRIPLPRDCCGLASKPRSLPTPEGGLQRLRYLPDIGEHPLDISGLADEPVLEFHYQVVLQPLFYLDNDLDRMVSYRNHRYGLHRYNQQHTQKFYGGEKNCPHSFDKQAIPRILKQPSSLWFNILERLDLTKGPWSRTPKIGAGGSSGRIRQAEAGDGPKTFGHGQICARNSPKMFSKTFGQSANLSPHLPGSSWSGELELVLPSLLTETHSSLKFGTSFIPDCGDRQGSASRTRPGKHEDRE